MNFCAIDWNELIKILTPFVIAFLFTEFGTIKKVKRLWPVKLKKQSKIFYF